MRLVREEDAKLFVAYFGDTHGNPWRPAHKFAVPPYRPGPPGGAPAAQFEEGAGRRFNCDEPDG